MWSKRDGDWPGKERPGVDGWQAEGAAGGLHSSPQHLPEHDASHICMTVFAQEEQIGAPNWSQAQNDKLLPREAIKS